MYDLYGRYYDATSPPLFEPTWATRTSWSSCATMPARSPGSRRSPSWTPSRRPAAARHLFRRHHHRPRPLGHAGAGLHLAALRRRAQGASAGSAALLVPDRQGASHLSLPARHSPSTSIRTGRRRRRRWARRSWTQLARQRFGDAFDAGARRGVVSAVARPPEAGLGGDRAGRGGAPDVAFFLRRNPGYAAGDELVCLTELVVGQSAAAGAPRVRRKALRQ